MISSIEKSVPLVVVVVLLLFCQVNQICLALGVDSQTLEQICSPQGSEPFGFSSAKQAKDLIKLFQDNRSQCPEEYHESFDDLEKVLSNEILQDVCGKEAYKLIRMFHSRYISFYTPEATTEQLQEAKKVGADKILRPIPESLRRFFILFALQINALCKRNSLARLHDEVDELICQRDFDLMKEMKYEASRLMGYEYVEHASRFKDLTILDDDGAGDDESGGGSKLYVQVRFGDVIKKAKDACEAKFRPLYNELLAPIIKLNNLGYKDELYSEKENIELDSEKKYRRWFGIIETCEILKDIEVIQDTSSLNAVADLMKANSLLYQQSQDDDSQEGTNLKDKVNKITLLSEQEAGELRERISKNIERDSSVAVYEAKRIQMEHQKLPFAPRMWAQEESLDKKGVKKFERRIKSLVSERTSYFTLQRKAFILSLKRRFHKNKIQFKNKDESSAVGKFAAFMDRHKVGVRVAISIVGLIVLVSVHFG